MSDFGISFMDKSKPIKERINEFVKHVRSTKRTNPDADGVIRSSNCHYCQGRMFLKLEYEWIIEAYIPNDVEPLHYVEPTRHTSSPGSWETAVYLPCDCHHAEVNAGQDKKGNSVGRQVSKFSDVFGLPLSEHQWGKTILAWRNERQQAIAQAEEEAVNHQQDQRIEEAINETMEDHIAFHAEMQEDEPVYEDCPF